MLRNDEVSRSLFCLCRVFLMSRLRWTDNQQPRRQTEEEFSLTRTLNDFLGISDLLLRSSHNSIIARRLLSGGALIIYLARVTSA